MGEKSRKPADDINRRDVLKLGAAAVGANQKNQAPLTARRATRTAARATAGHRGHLLCFAGSGLAAPMAILRIRWPGLALRQGSGQAFAICLMGKTAPLRRVRYC